MATGGFGTLPGLVLAYYLTDTLASPRARGPGRDGAEAVGRRDRPVHRCPLGRLGGSSRQPAPSCSRVRWHSRSCSLPSSRRPRAGGGAAATWVVLAFVAAATAFSIFQVPYIALPAEIAPDYASRTGCSRRGSRSSRCAILAFGAGGPLVRDAAGGGRAGYAVMGVVGGVTIGLGDARRVVGAPRRARIAAGWSPPARAW